MAFKKAKELRIEMLAEIEHQQWQHWMKYMIDNISNGECVERWKKQMKTDYKDLTEGEKESDRVWARKVTKLLFNSC